MITYDLLKAIHISCAILSATGFLLRGIWMLAESAWLNHPLTRTLPHIIDTMLLGSAVGLVMLTRQYPIYETWLNAKIVGLVLYIVIGSIALKRGETKSIRFAALFCAATIFIYIVTVALNKNPIFL